MKRFTYTAPVLYLNAKLLNLKETRTSAHITLLEFVCLVDNCGTARTCDTVQVGLAKAAERSNVVFYKVVLGKIWKIEREGMESEIDIEKYT